MGRLQGKAEMDYTTTTPFFLLKIILDVNFNLISQGCRIGKQRDMLLGQPSRPRLPPHTLFSPLRLVSCISTSAELLIFPFLQNAFFPNVVPPTNVCTWTDSYNYKAIAISVLWSIALEFFCTTCDSIVKTYIYSSRTTGFKHKNVLGVRRDVSV